MLPTASTKLPVKGAAKKEPEKVVERTSNLYRAQMALHSVLQAGKESYKDYRLEANAAELLCTLKSPAAWFTPILPLEFLNASPEILASLS